MPSIGHTLETTVGHESRKKKILNVLLRRNNWQFTAVQTVPVSIQQQKNGQVRVVRRSLRVP